jgi:hypothetical protein
MISRDYRDAIGGGLLAILGATFCWYAVTHYDIGSVTNMGPGLFPASLGGILAALGAAQVLPALKRPGEWPRFRFRPAFVIASAVAAFALVIEPFGLLPAVLAVVIVASFAESKLRPKAVALLALTMCLLSWAVFVLALGLSAPAFRWPF